VGDERDAESNGPKSFAAVMFSPRMFGYRLSVVAVVFLSS